MTNRAVNFRFRRGRDFSTRGSPHVERCDALACPCYVEAQRATADVVRRFAEDTYPEDVFTPNGTTPDAAGARFARKLCEAIARTIEESVDA